MRSGETIRPDAIEEEGTYPVFGGNGLRGFTSAFTHDGEHVLIGRQGALCGNINYARGPFWASEHAIVVTPNHSVDLTWLGECLRAMNLNQYSLSAAQPGLSVEVIGRIPVPVPPFSEQLAIGQFLRTEIDRIDALVAEQRRLIELLQEKRQAVISHAVTKGLNPDAPMKPSGVEWLGDVPQHWHVIRLKYLITSIEQGWSPQCAGEPADDGEWGVLKVGCVNGNRLNDSEQKELPSELVPPSELEINEGDILMSRGNTLDLVGMAAIAEKVRPRLLLSDLLYRFRVLPDQACGQFVVHVLRSPAGRFQLERDATGTSASMKKISQRVIAGIAIAIPPLEEQHSIVSAVRLETNALDQLTATAVSAIDLLRERRTALVSAAVTGQIDVRGIAAEEVA